MQRSRESRTSTAASRSIRRREFKPAVESLEVRRLLSGTPELLAQPGGISREFTDVSGTAYFVANDGASGDELWKSDGTPDGTMLLKDIRPVGGSNPRMLTNVNGTLFFTANDGQVGEELWKSDGTPEGTVLVKNLWGTNSSSPGWLANVGGTLYFTGNDGSHGFELWKSDGTEEGTVEVKNINPSGSSVPHFLTDVGGTVFFVANDGLHGNELWKSDGTEEGTELVKDIRSGSSGSLVQSLANVGGTLFFSADEGTNGSELWKTDGTSDGTELVKNISMDFSSSPSHMTNLGGTLFFSARDDLGYRNLWKSDGTEEGTMLVKQPNPNADVQRLTSAGGMLFFIDNRNGELWVSDGSETGTLFVKDLGAITNQLGAFFLTEVDGKVYFPNTDATYGVELWESDGTSEGTLLVADIRVDAKSSFPGYGTNVAGALFFSAIGNSGVGTDPWVLHPESTFNSFVYERQLVYNNSKFDGHTPGADLSDLAATGWDKLPYIAGSGPATFANISSYSRGINAVLIELGGTHGTLSANDFKFKVGTDNTPDDWAQAPAPVEVAVFPRAGNSGADVVEIVWADGAIANTWLQVIFEGNDAAGGFNTNTGLPASDVFYFGSRIGDTGSGTPTQAITSAEDEIAARFNTGHHVAVTNVFDFDHDGLVSAVDQLIARYNAGLLPKIDVAAPLPEGPPRGPSAAADEPSGAVAAALAMRRAERTTSPLGRLAEPRVARALRIAAGQRWALHGGTSDDLRGTALLAVAAETEGGPASDAELLDALNEFLPRL